MIDCHVHLVDFRQRLLPQEDLQQAMDEADVSHAVVFGLPVRKKWELSEPQEPGYYLDDLGSCYYDTASDAEVARWVARAPAELRARLAPLICSFDPTDRLAVEHVERAARWSPHWRGLGEVLLRHGDLSSLLRAENARAGHPALDPVLDYAASRSWPVSIHQDSSAAGRSLGNEYVDELDGMLARHPSTTVVWCHGGVSPRVGSRRQAELLQEMLDRHRQLHVDLSWSVWDVASTLRDREPAGLDGAWLSLVAAHPDRFVLGSDSVGSVNGMRDSLHRALPLLDGLPAADADLVRQGNAERLWFS